MSFMQVTTADKCESDCCVFVDECEPRYIIYKTMCARTHVNSRVLVSVHVYRVTSISRPTYVCAYMYARTRMHQHASVYASV